MTYPVKAMTANAIDFMSEMIAHSLAVEDEANRRTLAEEFAYEIHKRNYKFDVDSFVEKCLTGGFKVGDLVRVPECITDRPSYIGVVTEIAGYKITVQGGEHLGVKGWDGTPGVDTWDRADLELIKHEKK